MTIEELIVYGNKYLHKDEIKLILSTLLEMNPLELTINLDRIVNSEKVEKYKKVISYIQNGKPIQYALSNACFYGYDYYINENVLIPRFETEELVYNSINYIRKYFIKPKVLDICTGSGCIGLTIKQELKNTEVSLSDISESALEVANFNKKKYNLDCEIVLSDLFSNINKKYDVLLANPPYVAYDDEIDDIVKDNEPPLALYADNHGLAMYERIFKGCESILNDRYMIAIEIGEKQNDSVIKIINKYLDNVTIIAKKDSSNRDRMIFVFKNVNLNE